MNETLQQDCKKLKKEKMNRFMKAQQLFDQNDLSGSLRILDEGILREPDEKQLYSLRARIRFKQQDWGGAMNDFSAVLELEPDNKEAISGLEMTRNILGYFNPDLFNP